ncbi:MAG: GIY-YIG nuclease family protein [Patescibacteria group bacterium]
MLRLSSLKFKRLLLYIGYTNNLKKRFSEHNKGINRSTKGKRPWKLVYYEACINETDAKS